MSRSIPRLLLHCSLFIIHCSLITACSNSDQDESVLFFHRANLAFQSGEYRQSIKFYNEAIEKNPDFADAYNNRGLANYRIGNFQAALDDYNRAIEKDAVFWQAYFNRAEVRADLNDLKGSSEDLSKIRPVYQDSTYYYVRLGNLQVKQSNLSSAQAAYEKALLLDPKNAEALTNRGVLFFNQKQYDLAKAYLLLQSSRPDDALKLIQQSIKLDDQNGWAHRNLGIYYLAKNQPAQAISALKEAERLDPSVENVYAYLGQAYQQSGNLAQACQAWKIGISSDDELAKVQSARFCR
jgi:tetratricopeptide (TPR) repeat protein